MISKPETEVSVRVRTYKWHRNNLTSELIPAGLSVNCFSDLGEPGWKKISYLFQNRQDTAPAPTIPHFRACNPDLKVSLCDMYLGLTERHFEIRATRSAAWGPYPAGLSLGPPCTLKAQPWAWHTAETQYLLNKQNNLNSEDFSHYYRLYHFQLSEEAESQSYHL